MNAPGTDKLLTKAERALAVAQAALEAGESDVAAGRAYYAMVYAAKALLNERSLRLHAHARIVAALEQHFEAGEYVEWLRAAAGRRGVEDDSDLTYADAAALTERAASFVAWARRLTPRPRRPEPR